LKTKYKKIFWPSSIAVFGTKSNLENVSQDPILNPNTIYGISKLAGEKLISYYNKKYDLDIRSLRYPGIISFESKPGGGTTDYVMK
jgi:nucleoside-diphosphate-sugar epimerase